ncbi:MAG: hypothetical protein AB7U20_00905 [Planctomycetaceae bacterium]
MKRLIIITLAGLLIGAAALGSTAEAGRWVGRYGYHYPTYRYPAYRSRQYGPGYYGAPYYRYHYRSSPGYYQYNYGYGYPGYNYSYGPGFSIWW